MEHEFWHERWSSGQTAFHQPEVNGHLKALWPRLRHPTNTDVLVPLCGKSLDMVWLAEQQCRVIGVELSPQAVDAFFEENNIARTVETRGAFTVSSADGIEIWCGDFFALPADVTRAVRSVYDRGALVALPKAMRGPYARHLARLLQPASESLLLCVNYDQSEMDGPPFAISDDMIARYFADDFTIEPLLDEAIADIPERFRERGLTAMRNSAHILRRN